MPQDLELLLETGDHLAPGLGPKVRQRSLEERSGTQRPGGAVEFDHVAHHHVEGCRGAGQVRPVACRKVGQDAKVARRPPRVRIRDRAEDGERSVGRDPADPGGGPTFEVGRGHGPSPGDRAKIGGDDGGQPHQGIGVHGFGPARASSRATTASVSAIQQ